MLKIILLAAAIPCAGTAFVMYALIYAASKQEDAEIGGKNGEDYKSLR